MKLKILKSFLVIVLILIFGCNGNDKIQKIEASGTIEATNITVSSKTSGEIMMMAVNEGNNVNEGDTLLIIDHDLLEIQLNQATAGKDVAEAQLKLLKNGARKEDIAQVEESVKQAEINNESAKDDFNRMSRLFESKSITKKQYEDAAARYKLTQAQLNAVKENLSKLKNFARPEELKQAEANLNRSISSVDLLKKNISDSYVISPAKGIVVKRYVEKGETVSPMSSLFKISDLSTVHLIIYVSEKELGFVKPGQSASVTIDSYPDKKYEGKIVYISPEAEFTPKNIQTKDERTKLVFAVKIEINNPNLDLKPGMPADAEIKL